MANTRNHAYLSDQQVLNLTIGLCETFSGATSVEDTASLLLKLMSPQELRTLIIRLRVQKMLLEGATYASIKQELHVSSGTIARMKLLLEQNGIRPVFHNIAMFDDVKRRQPIPTNYPAQRVRRKKGVLAMYGANAWPIDFLGALIEALQKKSKPPNGEK